MLFPFLHFLFPVNSLPFPFFFKKRKDKALINLVEFRTVDLNEFQSYYVRSCTFRNHIICLPVFSNGFNSLPVKYATMVDIRINSMLYCHDSTS